MRINLARWDRIFRLAFGFLLTFWGAAGGPWWSWLGIYLIMTSSWGYCPLYAYFNLRTAAYYDEKRELE